MQRAEGGRMARSEGVSEHVVVQEVHVYGRESAIEIGRHTQGEELPEPDREDDLEPEPAQSVVAHAFALKDEAPEKAPELYPGEPEALRDDPAEEDGGCSQAEQGKSSPRGLHEPGEGEEAVLGASREDAAVAGAALEDAATARRVARLDEVRHPGLRKMELAFGTLVVVVKARNVRLHPIHGGRLEGRRGGGEADRHRVTNEAATGEKPCRVGDAAGLERGLEDRAGEAIDLHHEETPAGRRLRGAEPRPAGNPVHGALKPQNEIVDH